MKNKFGVFALAFSQATAAVALLAHDCNDVIDAATECLTNSTGNSQCLNCLENVLNGTLDLSDPSNCPSYEKQSCSSLDTCECATCQTEVEEAYRCTVKQSCGSFNCTTSQFCAEELVSMQKCVDTLTSSCENCVADMYVSFYEQTTYCKVAERDICLAILENCDCGDCKTPLADYYSCRLSSGTCDPLDCSLKATPPPVTLPPDITELPTVLTPPSSYGPSQSATPIPTSPPSSYTSQPTSPLPTEHTTEPTTTSTSPPSFDTSQPTTSVPTRDPQSTEEADRGFEFFEHSLARRRLTSSNQNLVAGITSISLYFSLM